MLEYGCIIAGIVVKNDKSVKNIATNVECSQHADSLCTGPLKFVGQINFSLYCNNWLYIGVTSCLFTQSLSVLM